MSCCVVFLPLEPQVKPSKLFTLLSQLLLLRSLSVCKHLWLPQVTQLLSSRGSIWGSLWSFCRGSPRDRGTLRCEVKNLVDFPQSESVHPSQSLPQRASQTLLCSNWPLRKHLARYVWGSRKVSLKKKIKRSDVRAYGEFPQLMNSNGSAP